MIQGGFQDCYLPVAHHVLVFLEAPADYLSRMTWMIMTSHVLLMLMMLIHWICKPGTSIYLIIIVINKVITILRLGIDFDACKLTYSEVLSFDYPTTLLAFNVIVLQLLVIGLQLLELLV